MSQTNPMAYYDKKPSGHHASDQPKPGYRPVTRRHEDDCLCLMCRARQQKKPSKPRSVKPLIHVMSTTAWLNNFSPKTVSVQDPYTKVWSSAEVVVIPDVA